MLTGKTESGFEFELRDEVFNDFETSEALVNYIKTRSVVNLCALEEQMFKGSPECRKAAREFLKGDKGYVANEDVDRLINEIYGAVKDGKN